ncbi:Surfeit locus protein 6 like [Pseudolycoriella hygida]|uniref:Surfeit locus protein 6 like n=1 Tax=Pseudolycoriella hygida TaxID=35572 RepID=A0A9Q0RXR7_9DIPT|nr:Surfeit locus protein 6 like [Pseudolycoriella hygida]
MPQATQKFDANKLRKLLEQETEYISNLFAIFDVPDSVEDDTIDEQFLLNNIKSSKQSKLPQVTKKSVSAQESKNIEEKLEIMKNKWKSKKSKPTERTIKKRELKKLKKSKEFKKKMVSIAKSTKNEKIKEEKLSQDNKDDVKSTLVYNEEGKMLFPKFEFAAQKSKAKKSKKDKVEKNPKLILKTIKKQKREIEELKEQGEEEKAKKISNDLAWKKAFDKVEGKKVKDDTTMLHKTIKRRKVEKKKSKTEWKQRQQKVAKGIEERQKKRQENIKKKSDEKKKHKLKKLAKRGRVIPGYG